MKCNAISRACAAASLGAFGLLVSVQAWAANNAIFSSGEKVLGDVKEGSAGWMDLIFILSIMAMAIAWAVLRKPILGWLGVVLIAAFLAYHAEDLLSLVKST